MRAKTWFFVAVFSLLVGFMPLSAYASPQVRAGRGFHRDDRGEMNEVSHGENHEGHYGGYHSGRVFVGPYYAPGWSFGWGGGYPWMWGPPSYYYPRNNVVELRHVNYGTLEFKVKPENTKVYVDGEFIGTIKDLDHNKAYVAEGNHEIALKAPDGKTMERNIYVAAGKKIKIEDKL
jgi:hypothetical protein